MTTTVTTDKRRSLIVAYRFYLALCRTPLSPQFLYFFPLYRRVTALLRRLCRGVVLDVGAGVSPFYRVAKQHSSYYCSLDYPESSELSPFQLPPAAGTHHMWADAAAMPVKNDSCDVVICTSVLEHTVNPQVVLSEIFRVLRPEGIVIGSVPFGHNLHMEPYDYFRISSYGLQHLAQSIGFRVVRMAPVGNGIHAIGACTADLLFRNLTGLKRSTMASLNLLTMIRLLGFLLVYPFVVVLNVVAPLMDRCLPVVILPVHNIFVFEKTSL